MRAGVYRPVENRGGELLDRIRSGPPLLLDGATGTELERRGVPTPLPLWSAPALFDTPEIVEAIHLDYAAVGVDALTANTFRTQRRTLSRGGWGDRAGETTRRAVEIARRAAARAPGATPFVLGSAPPLEDCYRPDLVPEASSLAREHAEHAEHLAGAGVDGVLVETMNTVGEALAALRAVRATGLPALVSFVCWEGATLLSGEALAGAADAVTGEGADAVMVNCLPTGNVGACLPDLARCALPFGVYANLGAPDDDDGFRRSDDCTPETFADHASAWRDAGARILGGCCGTTPEHLGALARRLSKV